MKLMRIKQQSSKLIKCTRFQTGYWSYALVHKWWKSSAVKIIRV